LVTGPDRNAMSTIHAAQVVLPVDGSPIHDGAVAVSDGRILAVGTLDDLAERFPQAAVEVWAGIMTPGLVNAHTHLQYTSFHTVGAQHHADYTAWSVRFLEEYAEQADVDWVAVAHDGVDQMLRAGITAIGDVVTDFAARDVLWERDLPGVAYLEVIGVDMDDWTGGLELELRSTIASAPTSDSTTVGISPHAPYSVDGPVLTEVARLADELGVRTHIHVAESDGEDEFYRSGTGPLAERVRVVATRRVRPLDAGGLGVGATEYLRDLGASGPTCHFAHGVYLGATGRAIAASEGSVVALCPRSNQVVGVDGPPVADYLREHVPFAVGTDSLSSVGSLDLMADVVELRRLAIDDCYHDDDLDSRLLHAATMGGATALGLDDQLGSLTVGKRCDFAIFDPGEHEQDPVTQVVTSGPGHCLATVVAGVTRWRRATSTT